MKHLQLPPGLALVLICLTAIPILSCQPRFLIYWITLEVTDADTGAFVEGAEVYVPSTLFTIDIFAVEEDVLIGPTDPTGQTWLRVILGPDFRENYTFPVLIKHDGRQETLAVHARRGYVQEGDQFTVEVLELGETSPPIPQPRVVIGSSPPRIDLGGYIDWVQLASRRTPSCPEFFYELSTELSAALYIESFTVDGTIPDHFLGGFDNDGCLADIAANSSPVRVRVWLGSSVVETSEPFCIDAENTAVLCPRQ